MQKAKKLRVRSELIKASHLQILSVKILPLRHRIEVIAGSN
jgi:hypothetical protein